MSLISILKRSSHFDHVPQVVLEPSLQLAKNSLADIASLLALRLLKKLLDVLLQFLRDLPLIQLLLHIFPHDVDFLGKHAFIALAVDDDLVIALNIKLVGVEVFSFIDDEVGLLLVFLFLFGIS